MNRTETLTAIIERFSAKWFYDVKREFESYDSYDVKLNAIIGEFGNSTSQDAPANYNITLSDYILNRGNSLFRSKENRTKYSNGKLNPVLYELLPAIQSFLQNDSANSGLSQAEIGEYVYETIEYADLVMEQQIGSITEESDQILYSKFFRRLRYHLEEDFALQLEAHFKRMGRTESKGDKDHTLTFEVGLGELACLFALLEEAKFIASDKQRNHIGKFVSQHCNFTDEYGTRLAKAFPGKYSDYKKRQPQGTMETVKSMLCSVCKP